MEKVPKGVEVMRRERGEDPADHGECLVGFAHGTPPIDAGSSRLTRSSAARPRWASPPKGRRGGAPQLRRVRRPGPPGRIAPGETAAARAPSDAPGPAAVTLARPPGAPAAAAA